MGKSYKLLPMKPERDSPILMGILNTTPDSFYDRGRFNSVDKALAHARQMAAEGVDLIDIGGASSHPNAALVTEEEELARTIPLIEMLRSELSVPLSIDTTNPRVAAEAVAKGARFINDVTGFTNPAMQDLAASLNVDLCVMHNCKRDRAMVNPKGIVDEVMTYFEKQIATLTARGIDACRLILDPGIGFGGKAIEESLELIRATARFKTLGLRVMIGASRKGFLQKLTKRKPEETLPATLAVHSLALYGGADILRIHDVKEHRDLIATLLYLLKN